MEVSKSYKPITEADILSLEKDFNIILPVEYKNFLMENNGGEPQSHDYQVNGEYFDDIGWFFGIREYPATHDLKTENIESQNAIPPHYFCIGVSYGGNLICLSLKEEEFGSIYRWDHETANYDGEPWEDNMTKICDSIGQFIEMLYRES